MSERKFSYQTVKYSSEGLYKEKGSKFLAYIIPVTSIAEVENAISDIAARHPKARHICYAYRIGPEGEIYRFNDDGEPSGTAGRPIFNVLLSNEISDTLAAVVRYFGGTKLGVSGLIKAYKEASVNAMEGNTIIKIELKCFFNITYRIEDMGKLYDVLKLRDIKIKKTIFEPQPSLLVEVPLQDRAKFRRQILADIHGYQFEDIADDFSSNRLLVVPSDETDLLK